MKKVFLFSIMMLAMLFMVNMHAQEVKKEKKLKLSADVRFRAEMDRDSKKSDGSMRADRDRLRYRARFGAKYALNDNFEFGMRIRSGSANNPQSPHVTLGKYMESDAFSLDKAYIKVKSKNGLWAWAGKNSMPFWEQNELLWDGDVNPEGLSFGGKFKLGENSKLVPVLGYYVLDSSNKVNQTDGTTTQKFGDHSNMKLVQLKFCNKFGDNKLTISSGLVAANIKDTDPATDDFKYSIWATSAQFKLNAGLTFGLDYFSNLADYKDEASVEFENQKTGYDVSVKYAKNKFGAALTYAAIQKYAVVDMFAQDDWMRWDKTVDGHTYTRSSNFQGFELNFKYKFTKKFNTTLRFWNVEGIERKITDPNLETGTRIRLDFNIKF